jgi:YbgC/YbaW family acyl-CoA thioester hydrolase
MHKYDLNVRGYELDSFGHVNNSVYLNYFEQARWEIFHELGLIDYFTANNMLLVVTEIQIRYSREVKLFDKLEVRTIIRKEAPYLVFDHRMYFSGTTIKVCTCQVKSLFTDRAKIKYDIPEVFIAKLKLK